MLMLMATEDMCLHTEPVTAHVRRCDNQHLRCDSALTHLPLPWLNDRLTAWPPFPTNLTISWSSFFTKASAEIDS